MVLDHLALDLQALLGKFHQHVQALQQAAAIAPVQVAQTGAVNGHHAQRTGLLCRTEQAPTALEQFAHIQLQATAHRTHLIGQHVGIEEVLEIRQTVAGGHLEQALGVVAVPGKIVGDVVGRNRKGEHSSLGITRLHHLDVGTVEQVHLGL
ncbi:hypothetical protein D3C72_1577320 [compost metagenome]